MSDLKSLELEDLKEYFKRQTIGGTDQPQWAIALGLICLAEQLKKIAKEIKEANS